MLFFYGATVDFVEQFQTNSELPRVIGAWPLQEYSIGARLLQVSNYD
jgi:hypothetical protein